ncbi:MAG TPA: DUF1653 domain-containing protein [Candidatus Saccharimonadales bacterium]|nr:DUF1653 domain-containing protein [Candidatus Saccharimonadales bacterium]
MPAALKPGTYRHYKGNLYRVIGVGHHTETLEQLVFYRALYEDKEFGANALWARPYAMFIEEVEYKDQKVARFSYIGE